MAQTSIIEESYDDFDFETGEITRSSKRIVKKSKIDSTDEFIKVSKYLNTLFSYKGIPLRLVPISLLIAQEMEFKTNVIYLLKERKQSFAEMLEVSLDRVNKLIRDCQKYDIIRSRSRGVYVVNPYIFSTGSIVDTRNLQAHFDFDTDAFTVYAEQKNLITGTTMRKAVANRKDKKQIPGQLSIEDFQSGGDLNET